MMLQRQLSARLLRTLLRSSNESACLQSFQSLQQSQPFSAAAAATDDAGVHENNSAETCILHISSSLSFCVLAA